jgi:dihydropteroate synthase type 2
MRQMIDAGATMVNDITALADPDAPRVLAAAPQVDVVLMHARNVTRTGDPHADRSQRDLGGLVDEILAFFRARIAMAESAGIARTRLIVDPGMGMFLDAKSEASVTVLAAIPALRALGLPVYVSTSRKSFISALLGGGRAPLQRAHGTLATELFALDRGADYVRTHDPGALRDAWRVWEQLTRAERR